MVPKLLLLPLGGVVGDRLDARTVALTTDLVRCATQLLVGVQLLGGSPGLAVLAVAEACGGAAGAFAMPTVAPLVKGTVAAGAAPRQRGDGVAQSATRLAGPALAGTLVLTVGAGWAFVLDAATFGVSALLLTAVRVERVPIPAVRSAPTSPRAGGRSAPGTGTGPASSATAPGTAPPPS